MVIGHLDIIDNMDSEIVKNIQKHVYYFGGIMMTIRHLTPIREILMDEFGKDNVTVLSSTVSLDFPAPRKLKIAREIEERLQKGEKVHVICHSLGTVEVMRIIQSVSPELISKKHQSVTIDFVSPAGLFTTFGGMMDFLRRFMNNSLLREMLVPSLRRGIESLAIFPPIDEEEVEKRVVRLYPARKPPLIKGNHDTMKKLLRLDDITIDRLHRIDNDICISLKQGKGGQIKRTLIKRGKLLLPFIARFYKPQHKDKSRVERYKISHFPETGKILFRLLTGDTRRMMKKLFQSGISMRFLYLTQDPFVTKKDILSLFATDNWSELLESGRVIEVGDLGHSSHVVLPDLLRLLS